ncbi:Putative P-loop containing nucleoside triphosphate hydrolase, NWD NACHT-NTPase [Colletotrichum destructivum]|uniref:P-loop containing nucleoside triphosphate hydrolase, NWD NACHT-NTPase n=1 Tax=Colletotrichum destructivum TaxID=34406 RepID=A0AAX4IXL4_9PEZI|nr:Putative P-loop containing nucleoside triphosphate hydrolase, NWD NACHT-NTPase [Colletotrichum destructivum]
MLTKVLPSHLHLTYRVLIHCPQCRVIMSGKPGEQVDERLGVRKRFRSLLQKRFPSRSRATQPDAVLSNQQANSGDVGDSHDVQTTAVPVGDENDLVRVWDEAWVSMQSEEPDLLAKYERYLLAQDNLDANPTPDRLSGKNKKDQLLRTADLKITAAKAKLAEGGVSGRVKTVVEGAVTILIKGKDLVTAIATTEPHAALVWAGCSVLLPFLLNPSAERTAALEGFADAMRILCRFSVIETDLFNGSGVGFMSDTELVRLKDQLRTYLVQLYALIIKLQIRLVLRYDRTAVTRFFRDTVKADDWEPLVKSIKELEDSNFRDINAIGQHVLLHVRTSIERQGQQMSMGFAKMTKGFQRLEKGIEVVHQKILARDDATEDSKCVNAFNIGISYELQKDRNSVCSPDTGEWFFHHPEYQAFQIDRGPQLLFITAEAGGGKSTTMRTFIDKLQAYDEPPLIAYFFFKDDDDRLRSYDDALSCLIYQLLVQEPGLVQHAKRPYREFGDGIRHHTREMWHIIREIASHVKRDIFCILDAVDECTAPHRKKLVTDLTSAFQDILQSTSRLKIVASSRPYHDENHPYAGLCASNKNVRHLAGEDAQVQTDIRKVIRFKTQELARKRGLEQGIQEMLVVKLFEQNVHTRSFLAVQMAFELLDSHNRMQRGAGKRTISIFLADIPKQLGDQFDEMLRRSLDREHAWRLFCAILAARRTLKIPEFKVIYTLTQPTSSTVGPANSYDELELPTDDEEFKRLIRSRCGLFITFVGDSVHLFHQTAREHLMEKTAVSGKTSYAEPARIWEGQTHHPNTKHGPSWKGSISKADANLVCATVCLDILTFTVSQTWVLKVLDSLNSLRGIFQLVRKFVSERPFLQYAAYNWHEHVVLGGDRALRKLSDSRYKAILDLSKTSFWVWFLPLAGYINFTYVHPKAPISNVWSTEIESHRQSGKYGSFLRGEHLEKLFPMGKKVRNLLENTSAAPSLVTPDADGPQWRAEEGYHLIDAFYLAFGDFHLTSASKAVQAMEQGDKERGLMLSTDVPISTLIWTCIADVAPRTLHAALASVSDLEWLHNVPQHIIYRRSKFLTDDLRKAHQEEGWTKPWPPACSTIHAAGASNSSASINLFGALADWVEASPQAAEHSQQLWEAGGFLVPSLCRRLVDSGASIHCEMWRGRRTALQIAASLWEHDLIQILLDLGADPSNCSKNGYTALHWLLKPEDPIDEEHTWANTNEQVRERRMGQPRYQKSRIAASVKALARPLYTQRFTIDLPCKNGKTPLMLAVRSSQTATRTLLDEGAEPDKRDNRGRTALMHFFRGGFSDRSISILEQLLHAGADSRAFNSSGRTAMGYWARSVTSTAWCKINAGPNIYNKVFRVLATLGALAKRDILVQEVASLDVPLMVASRLGNAQLCWALLDAGANPDKHGVAATSPLGAEIETYGHELEELAWNPVLVALRAKAYVTAAILLAYGADVCFQVPKRERTKNNKDGLRIVGTTPLHLVVGGTDRNGWDEPYVVLDGSRFYPGHCAFDAAAVLSHHSVSKLSSSETLSDAKREDDVENSDSEYEIKKDTNVANNTGALMVPFDTLFESAFFPKAPCDPMLEAIISKQQTPTDRQEALAEYMLGRGASVNARTQQGITPLMTSIIQGHLGLARLLLRKGADPNIAAVGGCTPLILAAMNGRRDLVETLLTCSADPDAQLDALPPDECPCGTFVDGRSGSIGHCHAPLSALAVAVDGEHYDVVEALLSHGANANLPIVHHAHGKIPSRHQLRSLEVYVGLSSWYTETELESELEPEPEPERWEGRISIGTALTWARGEMRDLLLRHGADPTQEEAVRECFCPSIGKSRKAGFYGDDDSSNDGYPTSEESDSGTDLPLRRRHSSTMRSSSSDCGSSGDSGFILS